MQRFLDDHSEENWDDIHGIIVNAGSMRRGTIWQCVVAFDPTLRAGRDAGGPRDQGGAVMKNELLRQSGQGDLGDAFDGEALWAAILGKRAARKLAALGQSCQVADTSDAYLLAAGLTEEHVAAIRAALVLGRLAMSRLRVGQTVSSASAVAGYFRTRIGHLLVEEFHALALDVRHSIVADLTIGRGTLTGVDVHPRDIFRPLIVAGAFAVILAHNHPSGNPAPSQTDVSLTARLREVGALCGIPVLDHVIVTRGGDYTSFAEREAGWSLDAEERLPGAGWSAR